MEHTKKEVKYKTKREESFYTGVIAAIATFLLFIIIMFFLYTLLFWNEAYNDYMTMAIIFFIASFVYTVYYLTPNCKRKKYAKNGETFAGTIIGAHFFFQGGWLEHAYYLIIEFYENGERKLRYSEPYAGSPRCKLRDTSCEVYKWKGKYIEGGLHALYKGEESKNLPIPISEYHRRNRKEYDYV